MTTVYRKDLPQVGNPGEPLDRQVRITSPCRVVEGFGSVSEETKSFIFSYWLGVVILSQGRSWSPGVAGSFKRLLQNVLKESDLLGYIEACSHLRECLCSRGLWDRGTFKFQLRWIRGLVAAIETAIPTNQIVHPSSTFDAVVTFLGWLKRLPVCIRPTSDSVAEYYENDRRLRSVDFDRNLYVSDLEEIWEEWFGGFRLTSPFLPRHGSGSTADAGRVRARKWRALRADAVASVCFRYPNLEPALDIPKGSLGRISKVVFVPKQAGKDRTICMEPASLQFLQQGVARQLIAYTHRSTHPMSKYVDLFSQERNRDLCAVADMRGLATIDLSDASDSVSWRLIKRLCRRMPLLRYLYGSRSQLTIIDGKTESFDKFAPMGSALCFPVECMVFASIVELAFRLHYGKASKGHLSGCSVYGDDIICPSEIYYLVTDILQSLGFKVNASKSFSSGIYYESCGVEYCRGFRINAIRHPRSHLLPKKVMSPDMIGLVTDLANSLLQRRYFLARRYLLKSYSKSVVRVGNRVVPFMDLMDFSSTGCIPLEEPYTPKVWNESYQSSGRFHWALQTVQRNSVYDFLDWKYDPELRSQCTSISGGDRTDSVHEKWSVKATLSLARMKHSDLLRDGDIKVAGTRRAGRLRYRFRRYFKNW